MRAIKVSTVTALPTNGQWDHLFFTYDGSGKAAGVKLYVNGAPVATKTISDTLDRKSMRTPAPLQLGRKSPDEQPARDTRYQDHPSLCAVIDRRKKRRDFPSKTTWRKLPANPRVSGIAINGTR